MDHLGEERRRRHFEAHALAAYRMDEAQDPGMEQDPIEAALDGGDRRIAGSPAAIEPIAQKRMAERGEMDADLVGAPGLEPHFEPRGESACCLEHAIVADGPLAACHHCHPLAIPGVAADRSVDGTGGGIRDPAHHPLVDPLDAVDGELGGKPEMGAVVFGGDEDAADVAVEAVDDAGAGDAADAGEAGSAVGEEGVDEGAGGVAGCRMYHRSCGFDQDEEVFVLVEDVKG